MAKFMYTGGDERVYPEYLLLGGSLVVDAGAVYDFGDHAPPGDGMWVEAPARAKVTDPPATVATPEQPLSPTSSDAAATADGADSSSDAAKEAS